MIDRVFVGDDTWRYSRRRHRFLATGNAQPPCDFGQQPARMPLAVGGLSALLPSGSTDIIGDRDGLAIVQPSMARLLILDGWLARFDGVN